jgi:hypothetical protein
VQKDHYLVATGGSQISEEASLVSIARQMGDIPRLFRPLAAAGRMNPCCRYVARARSYRPNENCHLSFRFVSLAFDPVRSDSRLSRNGRRGFSRGNIIPTALPAIFWRVNMRPALIIDDPVGSGWSSFC